MPTLIAHYAQCRRLLCQAAKRREKVTYGALATALGLKSPRQERNTVLSPIAADEVNNTGQDLTLVVVYASGPARGLRRYFSNIRGGALPQPDTYHTPLEYTAQTARSACKSTFLGVSELRV